MLVSSTWENKVCDLADETGMSYGEAERQLLATEKQAKPRTPRMQTVRTITNITKTPKEPSISYAKVIKMAKGAGKDFCADNPDAFVEDVAYDIADGLLYDPQVYAAVRKQLVKNQGSIPSRQIMKEILADYVAEGAT